MIYRNKETDEPTLWVEGSLPPTEDIEGYTFIFQVSKDDVDASASMVKVLIWMNVGDKLIHLNTLDFWEYEDKEELKYSRKQLW